MICALCADSRRLGEVKTIQNRQSDPNVDRRPRRARTTKQFVFIFLCTAPVHWPLTAKCAQVVCFSNCVPSIRDSLFDNFGFALTRRTRQRLTDIIFDAVEWYRSTIITININKMQCQHDGELNIHSVVCFECMRIVETKTYQRHKPKEIIINGQPTNEPMKISTIYELACELRSADTFHESVLRR